MKLGGGNGIARGRRQVGLCASVAGLGGESTHFFQQFKNVFLSRNLLRAPRRFMHCYTCLLILLCRVRF